MVVIDYRRIGGGGWRLAGGSEKLNRNLFPEDENPPKKGGRAGG